MTRILLALCLLAAPLSAQIAYVTGDTISGIGSGGPFIMTVSLASGDTRVLVSCNSNLAGKVTAVADSGGTSTWARQDSFTVDGTTGANDTMHVELWASLSGTAANGVKVTVSSGSRWLLGLAEYSGVTALGSAQEATAQNSATARDSATTNEANDYVSGGLCTDFFGNAQTHNLGTIRQTSATQNGPAWTIVDTTAASATLVKVATNVTGSPYDWLADVMVLRSGGGGGSGGGCLPWLCTRRVP